MSIDKRLDQRAELIVSNKNQMIEDINSISKIIVSSLASKNKMMFCGNGGSAAESQHMAAEYCATLNHKNFRIGMPAISLTVDTSFITAWSNDFGFLEVFSRQVETLGKKNDVLICYTTSGTSKNIFEAAKKAKSLGIKVILFTGDNKDIPVRDFCDYIFHAPTSRTANIQELHNVMGHEICLKVEQELFNFNEY